MLLNVQNGNLKKYYSTLRTFTTYSGNLSSVNIHIYRLLLLKTTRTKNYQDSWNNSWPTDLMWLNRETKSYINKILCRESIALFISWDREHHKMKNEEWEFNSITISDYWIKKLQCTIKYVLYRHWKYWIHCEKTQKKRWTRPKSGQLKYNERRIHFSFFGNLFTKESITKKRIYKHLRYYIKKKIARISIIDLVKRNYLWKAQICQKIYLCWNCSK